MMKMGMNSGGNFIRGENGEMLRKCQEIEIEIDGDNHNIH